MCKTSYEELSLRYPDMREQVDATLSNISAVLYWPGAGEESLRNYMREHLSNLALTCVSFVEEKGKGQARESRRAKHAGR